MEESLNQLSPNKKFSGDGSFEVTRERERQTERQRETENARERDMERARERESESESASDHLISPHLTPDLCESTQKGESVAVQQCWVQHILEFMSSWRNS